MNNIEIGLFFDRNHLFDAVDFSHNIKNFIPDLLSPIILPISENNNNPFIIFDKNEHLKMYVSQNNILIHINEELSNIRNDLLKELFNIMNKINIKIVRIGVVITKVFGTKERDLLANNVFDSMEIINARNFQLSYFQEVSYDDIILNCWKRYVTSNSELFVTYDINTNINDILNVNYKYAVKFINFANDYMKNNQIVQLY